MKGRRIDWQTRMPLWQRVCRWFREWEIEVYQLDNHSPRENAAVRVGIANWMTKEYTHLDLAPGEWRELLPRLEFAVLRNMARPLLVEDEVVIVGGGLLREHFTIPACHLEEVVELLTSVVGA